MGAVRLAAVKAVTIPSPMARTLWLSQLVGWLPREDRGNPARSALSSLTSVGNKERPDVAVAVIVALDGILGRSALAQAAADIAGTLDTPGRLAFEVRIAWLMRLGAEAVVDRLIAIPDERLRLAALRDWTQEVTNRRLLRWPTGLVESFLEPDLQLAACVALLRALSSKARPIDDHVGPMLALIERSLDVEIVNELLDGLAYEASAHTARRLRDAQLAWNVGRVDPEQRARGCTAAIGLGMPNDLNARLAEVGISALAEIVDDAVCADILVGFVHCGPGGPVWAEAEALREATRIADDRLRAQALTALLSLGAVRQEALHEGLKLGDAWARATVIFGWGSASLPIGWSRTSWNDCRLTTARAVDHPGARVRFLTIAASERTGDDRDAVAREALAAALELGRPVDRARAIYALVKEGLVDRALPGCCAGCRLADSIGGPAVPSLGYGLLSCWRPRPSLPWWRNY